MIAHTRLHTNHTVYTIQREDHYETLAFLGWKIVDRAEAYNLDRALSNHSNLVEKYGDTDSEVAE